MKKHQALTLLTVFLLLVSPLSSTVYAKKDDNHVKKLGIEKTKIKQNNKQESKRAEKIFKEKIKTNTVDTKGYNKGKSPVEHLYLLEKNLSTGEVLENSLGKITALTHNNKIILNAHNLETLSLSLFNITKKTYSDNQDSQQINENWLSDWSYRKSHTIVGSVAGTQTCYQILIQVNYGKGIDQGNTVYLDGKCKPDFGDIRFTSVDTTTELDYWVEEFISGEKALIWVEVDEIPEFPKETIIYIYYGNKAAFTTSSGEETFLLFSQDGLNSWSKESGDNWNTIDVGGHYGLVLSSPQADDDYDTIFRDFEPTQGFRYAVDTYLGVNPYGSWRYSYKVNIMDKNMGYYDDAIHLFYRVDDTTYKMDRIIYSYENGLVECSPPTMETDPEYPYPKQWFTITLEVDGDYIRVYDDEILMENIPWDQDIQFSRIRLTSRRELRYEDNHRIMKLCNPEPNQTNWGLEESQHDPSSDFEYIVRFQKGDLADINFKVSKLEWLTSSKNKEVYRGVAEINGGPKLTFLLKLTNGGLGNTDHFFIEIWEGNNYTNDPLFQYQSEH
jgi:hypothetical protein